MAASKPPASRISVAHASSFTKHQQRYHVPSTKEFAWAISRVFNGYFTLAGQGDEADDAQQLIATYDTLAIVSSLQMSYYYEAFTSAAESAKIVDHYAADHFSFGYLGTVYLWLVTAAFYGLFIALVDTMICLICVHNLTGGSAQLAHLLNSARGSIMAPWRIWVGSSLVQMTAMAIECFIRTHNLDIGELTEEERAGGIGITSIVVIAIIFVFFCVLSVPVSVHIISQLYFSAQCFSLIPPPGAADERKVAWFADPSAAEIRELLTDYLETYGRGKTCYSNPNPDQFRKFMLAWARSCGSEWLSYMAFRKIDLIFEEAMQIELATEGVKIEEDDRLEGIELEAEPAVDVVPPRAGNGLSHAPSVVGSCQSRRRKSRKSQRPDANGVEKPAGGDRFFMPITAMSVTSAPQPQPNGRREVDM